MARGSNPGDDFDRQFNDSRRKGQERAARGEGPWADDKYLRDLRSGGEGQSDGGSNSNEGCGKATVVLLALGGSALYALGEAASRLV